MTVFHEWENFYVIVGSAAGALIGLEFVVVTLIAGSPALFVVGAATLLLLFVGIHNAWDAITYSVFVRKPEQEGAPRHP